jgi:hypothetical protein
MMPSPTTHNIKLLVQQKPKDGVVQKVPAGGRLMALRERSRVMGFSRKSFDLMMATMTPRMVCSGLGNTVIVDIITAN